MKQFKIKNTAVGFNQYQYHGGNHFCSGSKVYKTKSVISRKNDVYYLPIVENVAQYLNSGGQVCTLDGSHMLADSTEQ